MRTGITRTIFALLAVAIAWASVHVWLSSNRAADFSFRNVPIRCAIQLEHSPRHLPGLTVGYNYELLQRFAASMGDSLVSIVNARRGSSWTDSLRQGKVDIVVLPYTAVPPSDSLLLSIPVDSLTVWAVRHDCAAGLAEIDGWLGSFLDSEDHEPVRDVFLLRYSPHISPYDSLVKAAAKRLGWDWRLLSALIYSESQFHIELRSRRGAEGLMQILPSIAVKLGFTYLLQCRRRAHLGLRPLRRVDRSGRRDMGRHRLSHPGHARRSHLPGGQCHQARHLPGHRDHRLCKKGPFALRGLQGHKSLATAP